MANILLKAQDLSLSRRDRLLFEQLSFDIRQGQLWHLRGDNGSGKSSLLDLLVGLNTADSGQVFWFDGKLDGLSEQDLSAAMIKGLFHYCRQQNAVNPKLSIRENIKRQALWAKSKLSESQLLGWAEEVALLPLLDEPAGLLSQGQKQQISLARLRLFGQRTMWLLDEPFNSLDHNAVERLEHWIAEHIAAGGAAMLVSHTEQCQSLVVETLHLSTTTLD